MVFEKTRKSSSQGGQNVYQSIVQYARNEHQNTAHLNIVTRYRTERLHPSSHSAPGPNATLTDHYGADGNGPAHGERDGW